MRIYFKNLKPVSTNHAKKLTKNGRMYQTNETLAFKRAIFFKCLRMKSEFREFEENFDPSTEYIYALYTFEIPKSKFFTKKGELSKKSIDVDNCVKTLQDALFENFELINDAWVKAPLPFATISSDNNYNINVVLKKGLISRIGDTIKQIESLVI